MEVRGLRVLSGRIRHPGPLIPYTGRKQRIAGLPGSSGGGTVRTYEPYRVTPRMRELAGTPLASFRRRAVAFVFDLALATLLANVLYVVLLFTPLRPHLTRYLLPSGRPEEDAVFYLLMIGPYLVYFTLFLWLTNGSSPGKKLMRVRVLSLLEARITLIQAFARAFGYVISTALLGIGFLQYFLDPNHQTVQDAVAMTIVTEEKT